METYERFPLLRRKMRELETESPQPHFRCWVCSRKMIFYEDPPGGYHCDYCFERDKSSKKEQKNGLLNEVLERFPAFED